MNDELMKWLIDGLKEMTEIERIEFINQIRESVCIHCGQIPNNNCQCWNEE